MKRKITENIDSCIENKLIGKIDKTIEYCQELKEKHPLHDMYFEVYNCDDYFEISVYGNRDETDAEYEYRTAEEEKKKEIDKLNAEKSKEKMKESRYQKYLELKKEFEG
jgi:hypothetical protein